MKTQGDTKRPQSVKAEFDAGFGATAQGGGVLAERVMRRLGVRRMIEEHLPRRSRAAGYSTLDVAYALTAGLLLGGQGIGAIEAVFGGDSFLRQVFGLKRAPSSATAYRALCDWSGLPQRSEEETLAQCEPGLPALDMWGHERRQPRMRRIVPAEPEAAGPAHLSAQGSYLRATARRSFEALSTSRCMLQNWFVAFGDATDLEVHGHCSDAARIARKGEKALCWQTLMLGPVVVAQQLMPGASDEGRAMPRLFDSARSLVAEMSGRRKVLGLFDAAYFERRVIETISGPGYEWDFIVCANQQRGLLTRLAADQPEAIWRDTGADPGRGWIASQAGSFIHRPQGWSEPVTIAARRWRQSGDLPNVWRYSFLATRIEPEALSRASLKKHGYAASIWMLYGTKQGRENHYKTMLRDMGLHNPPSSRFGVNQAFYALGAAASNLAMVMRYSLLPQEHRGMELWRLRQVCFCIAGYLARSARTLTVRLSGVCVEAWRQALWKHAFAAAERL
jgi:hypothetical protein